MIHHITAASPDDAFYKGLELFRNPKNYSLVQTRNGPALRADGVVITEFVYPWRRVLFDSVRDANPFFHFMEALWILAGKDDVSTVAEFNKNIATYSDNGRTFHGAYGARLFDHLPFLIHELKRDKSSRRGVINLYDADIDLFVESKDVPCNIAIKAEIINDLVHLYVFNRSNDMIWGAYGANVVHFSFLQEYIADKLGLPVGRMTTVSVDFHVYCDIFDKFSGYEPEPTNIGYPSTYLLGADDPEFDLDLQRFMRGDPCETEFFLNVAEPMRSAWRARKLKNFDLMEDYLNKIEADDWRKSCSQWIERRRLYAKVSS